RVLDGAARVLAVLSSLGSLAPPVVHRDIKPQNIKLTPEGDVILIDFGLAKGSLEHMALLATESIPAYAPSYAALEQIRGQGTDVRSDLSSVAAAAYHLLTGRRPAD